MLYPMTELLRDAEKHHYAVGYFEAFNMDALLACLEAAERTKSPIIIGFGGQFLSSPKRKSVEDVYIYGAVAKAAAERSSVPAATLLNEADRIDMLYQGMNAGFGAVMYQKEGEKKEDTLRITQEICKIARYMGVDVESEVGCLPTAGAGTKNIAAGYNTDVGYAKEFVSKTGVDALAVSIGNIHLLESGKASLDFDLLKELRHVIPVPLVLHGGTGVAPDDMKRAILTGISKVNVGTVLKRSYINAIRPFYTEKNLDTADAHATIGWGGENDMLSVGREAITNKILEFIDIFGCAGMAAHY
jgi:ketose-bisphosphate aldolase